MSDLPGGYKAPEGFLPVPSVQEEYAYLATQRCECGGRWEMEMQIQMNVPGAPPDYIFDKLEVRCLSCDSKTSFIFRVDVRTPEYQREIAETMLKLGLEGSGGEEP